MTTTKVWVVLLTHPWFDDLIYVFDNKDTAHRFLQMGRGFHWETRIEEKTVRTTTPYILPDEWEE